MISNWQILSGLKRGLRRSVQFKMDTNNGTKLESNNNTQDENTAPHIPQTETISQINTTTDQNDAVSQQPELGSYINQDGLRRS